MLKDLPPELIKKIIVNTIHKAKGQEYEKVIIMVNTLDVWNNGTPYISLPDNRNEVTEERRVFYVAVTRAKQELVILGGNCQFIPEFQNVPPTKEDMEEAFKVELERREPRLRKELEEASKAALVTLKSKLRKKLEEASIVARNQHEPELNRLRRETTKSETKINEIELTFTKQLKSANDAFLKELIPVLDEFESQINSLPATTESNNRSGDFEVFTESVRLAHQQMLDSLKKYGLKPIEAVGEIFNPTYHEKVSPDIYSSKVPADKIVRKKQRGYLLQDQVVRKAQVAISKRKQRADVFLTQDFAQPIRFVTYAGFRDLRNIETF